MDKRLVISVVLAVMGISGCCFGGTPSTGITPPGTGTAPPPPPGAGPMVTIGPGFMPDPQTATGSAGGPVQASTMSSDCRGYINSAPNHIINATGAFANLRVIVSSSADTTLVIQRADGSFVCNDDFEGLNPGVQGPFGPGQHRVWVGTYNAASAGAAYTIGFTELGTVTAASLGGGGGIPGGGGLAGTIGTALIPHQCGMSVASYGPVVVGASVVLGRHTPWTGPDGEGGTVTGDDNWADDMSQWVGQRTTVTAHQGLDQAGCPVVHVAADTQQFYWRIRDMTM